MIQTQVTSPNPSTFFYVHISTIKNDMHSYRSRVRGNNYTLSLKYAFMHKVHNTRTQNYLKLYMQIYNSITEYK